MADDIDPNDPLLAGLNASAPSAAPDAAPSDSDISPDDPLLAELNANAPGSSTAATLPSGHGSKPPRAPVPHRAAAPTHFQQAGTPAPAPAPEKEPSWGEVGQQALHNALPSAGEAVGGLWNAVTHPGKTLANLGQIATGAGSQVMGALGEQQDPAQKAKNEALITALENHYKQGYGSIKGFKKNLATDPFGVAMDASTVLDAGAGALGKLGEVSKLGALSKAGSAVGKAASYVDPIQNAIRIAKAPGTIAGHVGRGLSSVATGVPASALDLAAKAGASTDPAVRAAYSQFVGGQGNTADFANAAQAAMQKIRDKASADYLAGKGKLAQTNPSFAPIDAAVAAARSKTMMGGRGFQQAAGQFSTANDALDEVEKTINAYKGSANPIHTSLDGVDNLKQAIWDQARSYQQGTAANAALMKVYHGAGDALRAADPAYAKLMESYQEGLRNTTDLTKTLGLGKNAAASATLAKNLKALKSSTGTNLLQQLMDEDPRIGAMLAGSAVNPWLSHGRSWGDAVVGAGGALAIAPHPVAGLAGVAGGLAASSPRISGMINYGGGTATIPLKAAANTARAVGKPAYYATRPDALTPGSPTTLTGQLPSGTPAIAAAIRGAEGTGKNPQSSARGPFQFLKGTFRSQFRKRYPDRAAGMSDADIDALHSSPEGAAIADEMGPQFVDDNRRWLSNKGIDPSAANTYLAHLLGGDAPKVIGADPSTPVEQLLPRNVIAANARVLANKTAGDVQKWAENTMRAHSGMATGGRIERADGGKVDDLHERLVQRLMTMAKRAKKASNEATKPLLNASDNMVAKALSISQRAI